MTKPTSDAALLRESIKVTRQAIKLIQDRSKLLAAAVKEMRALNKRLGSQSQTESHGDKRGKGRVVIATPSSAAPSSLEPDMTKLPDAELERLAKGEEA